MNKMYNISIITPVNLFNRQPDVAIVVTTISNMANSNKMEQNIPRLFTGYALPPEAMLYRNHGNGSLETTTVSKKYCKRSVITVYHNFLVIG